MQIYELIINLANKTQRIVKLLMLFLLAVSLIPAPVEFKDNANLQYDKALLGNPRESVGSRCSRSFRQKTAGLPEFARKEAYEITIGTCGVKVQALTQEGAFRARQTLRKLAASDSVRYCCTIFDYPRYAHRGLMLDESRSLKGKEFILKQIDAIACTCILQTPPAGASRSNRIPSLLPKPPGASATPTPSGRQRDILSRHRTILMPTAAITRRKT